MSVKILALESSCDETAAAVVEDGRKILSNVIATQIAIHKTYGGVVPEIASRKHMEAVAQVTDEALAQAGLSYAALDAVAVTAGPGLVGALLVGVSYAKSLAFAAQKPLVAVHHIEGHIAANYLAHPTLQPPFLCLVASGGHSHIVKVTGYNQFEIMGQTRDDAAGEAFDKAARVLGLSYPGGPMIDALAKKGNPNRISFPKVSFPDGSLDFSFSGVKTSLINFIHKLEQKGVYLQNFNDTDTMIEVESSTQFSGGGVTINSGPLTKADIAASFQNAVVGVLVERCVQCAKDNGLTILAISGGVAANSYLRNSLDSACTDAGISAIYPPMVLCTDNAAMIGSAAYFEYQQGNFANASLNATPYITLGQRLK